MDGVEKRQMERLDKLDQGVNKLEEKLNKLLEDKFSQRRLE